MRKLYVFSADAVKETFLKFEIDFPSTETERNIVKLRPGSNKKISRYARRG